MNLFVNVPSLSDTAKVNHYQHNSIWHPEIPTNIPNITYKLFKYEGLFDKWIELTQYEGHIAFGYKRWWTQQDESDAELGLALMLIGINGTLKTSIIRETLDRETYFEFETASGSIYKIVPNIENLNEFKGARAAFSKD